MDFLEQILARFGFAADWIAMVMRCVTLAKFVVKLNGAVSRCFLPHEGCDRASFISLSFPILCGEVLCLAEKGA